MNEYAQQVEVVIQGILNLQAANSARAANITAGGKADAAQIEAQAKRQAFRTTQATKSHSYSNLRQVLGLSSTQMQRYYALKSLSTGGAGKGHRVVVGLPMDIVSGGDGAGGGSSSSGRGPPHAGGDR